MKRKILCYALAGAMVALAYGADSTPAKKAPAKKAAAPASKARAKSASKAPAKKGAATRKPTTTTAASRNRTGKKAAPLTTWRNRQTAPTPERYKEIQDALVAKGFLKPEDVGGGWNQNSVEALKRFQTDQKIEASGKLNSVSLIALGLGPKRENPPPPPKLSDPGSNNDR